MGSQSEAGSGRNFARNSQSPFTGLFVGGFAIVLISLIAYFAENKMGDYLPVAV